MEKVRNVQQIEVSTEYETIVNPPLKEEVVLEPTFSIPFTFADIHVDIAIKCETCNEILIMSNASNVDISLSYDMWEVNKYQDNEYLNFLKEISSVFSFKYKNSVVHLERERFQFSSKTYIPNIYYTKCPHCGSQNLMFYEFIGGGQDRCPVTLTIDCIWQVHLDEAFAQKYLTVER